LVKNEAEAPFSLL